MKRIFALIIVFCCILGVSVSLTGCTDKAIDFPTSTIENGYYNYIAGGNMACVNGSLYLNIKGGVLYLGTYKENNGESTKLFTSEDVVDYSVNSPFMYQLNDKIYFTDADYNEFRLFDCDNDSLTEEKFEIKSDNGICYMSEELMVWFSGDIEQHLIVKYKDNKEVILEKSVDSFTVYEDKIYFIDDNGSLYYNDPSLLSLDCVFISPLNQNGVLSKIIVCNGYCYFTDTGREETEEGVYRYSFLNDKVEPVLQKEILSMNVQGNKVYFATDKGIYVDDAVECKKFTSKKADELYVFDDEWIYLYNTDKGVVHRVSNDGTKIQVID